MVNVRHNEVLKASTSKKAKLSASDVEHDINDDVSSSSSEDPNFRGFMEEDSKALRSMINKQVGKAIKNVMPYYISQTTDNLKEIIQKELVEFKKERTTNDYKNEMASYHDFTACDVPKFDGALDPIVSTRWLAAVEGKVCEKGEEWIGSCAWKDFKELFNAEYTPVEEIDQIREEFQTLTQTNETVNELWKKFNDLIRYFPEYHGNEKLKVERFKRMLHDDIRENKEVKETKRKNEFRERDAKKPRHDHGRRSGGTQFKTPCTILVDSIPARVLYDSGASASFVSYGFSKTLTTSLNKLHLPLEVEITNDKVVVVSNVFPNVEIEIDDGNFKIDLSIMFGSFRFTYCFDKKDVEDVPIVNKFLDVFLEDLPGIPPCYCQYIDSTASVVSAVSISLDLSRLSTTLNRLERSIQIGIYNGIQKLGGNYRDWIDSQSYGNLAEIAAGIKSLREDGDNLKDF
ncbi:putative reverse transcriptase domain-containing protein [Tanacetum coccineum]|uniref:Reverse transcriptase domain-containing protein n=1 Tax=Tanacetum coccineum TaxID=301880 RepID=A0ABQ5JEA0_9ASTR